MKLVEASPLISGIARSLGHASEIWLDPADPFRRQAVQALTVSTGFHFSLIEKSLQSAFEELTEGKILDYAAGDPAFERFGQAADPVLHILAGNVFTAWLPGAVTTLLLGSECTLKPSSQERAFAPLWKSSLEEVDPGLAARVHIAGWEEGLLKRFPAVVAYGSDDTLAALKSLAAPGARFIGYGHKISVGVIACSALDNPPFKDNLRRDVEAFHLQGCLSPQRLYVQGIDPSRLATLLAGVPVMPSIQAFDSWPALKKELMNFVPHLSTLGTAGDLPEISAADLQDLGMTRVCPLGTMQQPPLTWRNGGFSLAAALTE